MAQICVRTLGICIATPMTGSGCESCRVPSSCTRSMAPQNLPVATLSLLPPVSPLYGMVKHDTCAVPGMILSCFRRLPGTIGHPMAVEVSVCSEHLRKGQQEGAKLLDDSSEREIGWL